MSKERIIVDAKNIPAFPTLIHSEFSRKTNDVYFEGMSLRDYFAGKALQGILSNRTVSLKDNELAIACYKIAELLIEERTRT